MTEISNESYKIFNANKKFDYSERRYLDPAADNDYAKWMGELNLRKDLYQISAFYDSTFSATDTDLCFSNLRRFSTSKYLKPLYEKLEAIDGRTYPLHNNKKLSNQLAESIGCNSDKIKIIKSCNVKFLQHNEILQKTFQYSDDKNFQIYLSDNHESHKHKKIVLIILMKMKVVKLIKLNLNHLKYLLNSQTLKKIGFI